jgi:hypothetical protein
MLLTDDLGTENYPAGGYVASAAYLRSSTSRRRPFVTS